MRDSHKEKVMRKLGRRSYSSHELRLKLKGEIPENELEDILKEFIEKGYINDLEWARTFVIAEESKGRGPMTISQKLRMKGYERENVEKVMDEAGEGGSKDALDLALAKKSRKFTERHKIVNALLRLGFHWEDIKARMGVQEDESRNREGGL